MSTRSVYQDFAKSSSDATKQLNIGWTVTSFILTGSFFIGLLLIAMLLVLLAVQKDYRENNRSKKDIVILGWVGFGLMIFGLWGTIGSFYGVVQKINQDVKLKRGCSLFNPENARNAVEVIAANEVLQDDINDYIGERKISLRQTTYAGDEYTDAADSSTRVSRRSRRSETASPEQKTVSISPVTNTGTPEQRQSEARLLEQRFAQQRAVEQQLASQREGVVNQQRESVVNQRRPGSSSSTTVQKIIDIETPDLSGINETTKEVVNVILEELKKQKLSYAQANNKLRELNLPIAFFNPNQ